MDIPKQIREGMSLSDGRMAYVVRKYSEENDYNRLFRQAFLEVEKRHPDFMRRLRQERSQFRRACRDLFQGVSGCERIDKHSLLVRTKKQIVNPVYREHEALRVTARAVLQWIGGYQSKTEEGTPFVTGVFLDISKLWELYLNEAVFKKIFPELRRRYCQRLSDILENALTVRPDFWREEEKVVLDAKYRLVWSETLGGGSWPEDVCEDVYQVLSYMLTLNCGQGGVVFPFRGPNQEPECLNAINRGEPRRFWRVGFSVLCGEMSYDDFRKEVNQEAVRLTESLRKKIFAGGDYERYMNCFIHFMQLFMRKRRSRAVGAIRREGRRKSMSEPAWESLSDVLTGLRRKHFCSIGHD